MGVGNVSDICNDLQGHSRSLILAPFSKPHVTAYLCFVFVGSVSYRFRDDSNLNVTLCLTNYENKFPVDFQKFPVHILSTEYTF